ncbi:MAG: hypothetical protein LAP87_10800 [Acidobacteriia bacterium]|nr:hypothetical protein [Terriglobia bacterium]
MPNMFKRAWAWLGQISRVRSLLQWFGWWEAVVSILSGVGAFIWSHLAGLAPPEQFVLALVVVLIVLGFFALVLHLNRTSPIKTEAKRAVDMHGNVWVNPSQKYLQF